GEVGEPVVPRDHVGVGACGGVHVRGAGAGIGLEVLVVGLRRAGVVAGDPLPGEPVLRYPGGGVLVAGDDERAGVAEAARLELDDLAPRGVTDEADVGEGGDGAGGREV